MLALRTDATPLRVPQRLAVDRRVGAARQPGAGVAAQRGLARVELAFVLIALGTLAAVSVPSFGNLVVAQRLRAAGTDLVATIEFARSEAIRRNDVVTVRPTAGQWTAGWVVATARGDPIARKGAPGGRVAVERAPSSIAFGPNGLPAAGGVRIELVDADKAPGIAPHCITVDAAGKPRIESRACE